MNDMFNYVNPRNGQYAPLLSEEVHKVIMDNWVLDSHYIQQISTTIILVLKH
jgi:ribonucleoside-diphosphate reductase alpha chain